MAARGRRYVRGAAGGVTAIAAAVLTLHHFQVTAMPQTGPSITGGAEPRCSTSGTVTRCAESGPRPTSASSPAGSPAYRDGSYAAQGDYLTPGGDEAIGVRLTVRAGRVVRSEVDVEATSPTARQFQRQFASRYARQVVSVDLAALDVTRVAGASLTSLGFDNAVAAIREAARADA